MVEIKNIKVGWIGTGVMGRHMAGHIMTKGNLKIQVYNRTASKADALVQEGAEFKSAIEIAKDADYLFLMLGYPHDVESMVLDNDFGILQHMKPGSYLIDHTTSTPELAARIAAQAEKCGVKSVDAPVSGGDVGAKGGCVVTMCGGSAQDVDDLRFLFDMYSKEVQHMGPPGSGQHTKMANQIMIANNVFGVCEALIYGHKSGLDLNQMILLLNKGAAGSA
jgi:3-hydroxyisobutyrate dehydrogenase